MNSIFLLMGLFAGACLAIIGGINAQLTANWSKHAVLSATVSCFVGMVVLWSIIIVTQIPIPEFSTKITWWHWTGGLLGAYFIFSLVYLSPRVGAGVVVLLILAGQIIAAVVLDHFGIVGYSERPITLIRVAGLACLAAGVILVRRS